MSTFVQLQDDVIAHHFSDSQYRSYAKDKINEAQAEVARRIDFRGLIAAFVGSLAAGVNTIDLVASIPDFLRMRWVKDENADVLLQPYPTGAEGFEADGLRDSTVQGAPLYWAIFGTVLYLYPATPSASYGVTVRYFKKPATLTADADVPAIPSELHHLLSTYAVSRCFRREGDVQMAQAFMADFAHDLGNAQVDYQWDDLPDSQTVQVAGAWG